MKRFAFALLACAACGGANPDTRAVVPAQADTRPAPIAEPKEEQRTTLEYVVVPVPWVEKVAPAPAADVKAWAAAPENKGAIRMSLQTMWWVGADAKQRAERAVARLAKGEDFDKVLRDQPQPAVASCDMLERDMADVGTKLAVGEVAKTAAHAACGAWFVVRREMPSDDDVAAAYKQAKAPELAKKLADEILARMRTADSTRAAIAGAVEGVLGDDAKENADRPQAQLVVDKNVERLHLSPEVRAALGELAKTGRTGQVAAAPIAGKNAFVAARVANAPPR